MTSLKRILVYLGSLALVASAAPAPCNANLRPADDSSVRRHPIYTQAREALLRQAIRELRAASVAFKRWARAVRPADGTPGRFRWAVDALRGADVGSTRYVLRGLRDAGVFDEVITGEDRKAGIAWVQSLHTGDGMFRDPLLVKPGEKMTDGQQEVLNRYAREILQEYGAPPSGMPPSVPPPEWPQPGNAEKTAVAWIKALPWDTNPWHAGSWAGKMMNWLLIWHQEGRISSEPLVESLKFIYASQDPVTGLWGPPTVSMQNRINGVFKLFFFLREQMDLPVPHARKIVDSVLDKMLLDPGYYETLGGCDELDNLLVVAQAGELTNGYRRAEIEKLAAYNIAHVLQRHRKADGGLSYHPDRCSTAWVGWKMAPSKAQGDAIGLHTLSSGITIAVDLLGLEGQTSWRSYGLKRPPSRTSPKTMALSRKIARQLLQCQTDR